jgi:hypothetical protein
MVAANLKRFGSVLLFAALFAASGYPAHAVAQWSRQYGVSCGTCHSPYPRLNETGMRFRLNGYRFAKGEKLASFRRTPLDYIGFYSAGALAVGSGNSAKTLPNSYKIHIGGAVGSGTAFLVQPTPGGEGDFNMAQGLLTWNSKSGSHRLTGGRIYAWGNGGGVGAEDRYPTATVPQMFSANHGVNAGGLGNGFRYDYTHRNRDTLSLFTTDFAGVAAPAQMSGVALTHRYTQRGLSNIEAFAAFGSVPDAHHLDTSAARYGLLANKELTAGKGGANWNLLGGLMYGAEGRAVEANLHSSFWTGFSEVDYVANRHITLLGRADWERNAVGNGARTSLILGSAIPLNTFLRLDTDVVINRFTPTSPALTARLRMVY